MLVTVLASNIHYHFTLALGFYIQNITVAACNMRLVGSQRIISLKRGFVHDTCILFDSKAQFIFV